LFGTKWQHQAIINLWRKLLKTSGEAVMVIPDGKEEAKRFIEAVDRKEFKITNMILTA
jgi:hypothetical protein